MIRVLKMKYRAQGISKVQQMQLRTSRWQGKVKNSIGEACHFLDKLLSRWLQCLGKVATWPITCVLSME
jgi:hypothetical protein